MVIVCLVFFFSYFFGGGGGGEDREYAIKYVIGRGHLLFQYTFVGIQQFKLRIWFCERVPFYLVTQLFLGIPWRKFLLPCNGQKPTEM